MKLYRKNVKKRVPHYLGTVKNTDKTSVYITELRKLIRQYGTITVWGRNPNRQKIRKVLGLPTTKWVVSIPRRYSTRLDLYVNRTDGGTGIVGIPTTVWW